MSDVTVVVPTYNRVDRLRRVIESLEAQTTSSSAVSHDVSFEVVVVSDGSTDGTHDYLRDTEFSVPVRWFTQENAGPAHARNRGIDEARGELVMFVDDDFVPAADLVATHVATHERLGDRVVVSGPMLDPPDFEFSPWTAWEQSMLRKQYDAMTEGLWPATARQFYTANASVHTEHLRAAGGFDPSFHRMEDIELGYRLEELGLEFHFEPDARGFHYAARSYASWLDIAAAYGRNDIVFGRQPGRDNWLDLVVGGFWRRNPVLQILLHGTVRSTKLANALAAIVERTVEPADRVSRRLSRGLLSCMYNTAYYRGMAAELGGSRTFFRESWARR